MHIFLKKAGAKVFQDLRMYFFVGLLLASNLTRSCRMDIVRLRA